MFVEIIKKKRDNEPLSQAEIESFVEGLSDGSLPAEQISAMAMCILLNGMTAQEAGWLTQAMAHSGTVLSWDSLPGPVVDKHSTGGVGDKVSLILAPVLAACGCYVPMISGRGLGHGGGTLDKLESIPGYDATPDLDAFQNTVSRVGCAIIGQTGDLAPADKRLYAIRDITATVESVPLITASILSKKIAAGLHSLVMDIKVGCGAFMKTLEDATALAASIINTADSAQLPCRALITDMNQILGRSAGNALEVAESVQFLRNENPDPRLADVTHSLCAEMLISAGQVDSVESGLQKVKQVLSTGHALEKFAQMISALGGPADFIDRYDSHLNKAAVVKPVLSPKSGCIQSLDTTAAGYAIVGMGGGRQKIDDQLDMSVGLDNVLPIGTPISKGDPLVWVHAANESDWQTASKQYLSACVIKDQPPQTDPVIYKRLSIDSLSD